MRTIEPAHVRRMKVLRQVAYSPDGLLIGEVRGFHNRAASDYMHTLARDGLVDKVPIRKQANPSQRPICRFVINEAGRALLVKEGT